MKLDFKKRMEVGLGDAVRRLNWLNDLLTRGIADDEQKAEHDLLMDALNNIKIDLGFDCDSDGVPDTIEIFTATAKTSCCRMIPVNEKGEEIPAPPKRRVKTKSRRR